MISWKIFNGIISLFCLIVLTLGEKKNQEPVAVDAIKDMKEKFKNKPPTFNSKGLLIATFMNASKMTSRETLLTNLKATYGYADFVVILYDGDVHEVNRFCNPKVDDPPALEAIIHCRRAAASYSPHHRFTPKPLLYLELLPYLLHYRRTMLVDEDVVLNEFNITEFLSIWDCAFYPSHPPLIVQGLLAEPTQYFSFVHYSEWKKFDNLTNVIASATDFVEQQMPAFDSMFLSWFIEHAMPYFLKPALQYQTDWGADGHWCMAAKVFAQHFYDLKLDEYSNTPYVACGLITGTSPLHHRDTQALSWLKSNNDEYVKTGSKVVDMWKAFFPGWTADYEKDPSHIDPTKTYRPYRKSYGIPKNCSLHYGNISVKIIA